MPGQGIQVGFAAGVKVVPIEAVAGRVDVEDGKAGNVLVGMVVSVGETPGVGEAPGVKVAVAASEISVGSPGWIVVAFDTGGEL